ncbi:MAG: hypothetical protein ABGZ35_02615, partial [Planctomycetaceae bacterium]
GKVELEAKDLQVTRDGHVSLGSASVTAESGVLDTLGIGGLLPFDVTKVEVVAAVENQRISLSPLPDALGVTVTGRFDFTVFEEFPATPVITVGPLDPAGEQQATDISTDIDITFRVEDGTVKIQDTGPITLGFADLSLGPVTLGSTITLGGFVNGAFDKSEFGATVDMKWLGKGFGEEDGNKPGIFTLTSGLVVDGSLETGVNNGNITTTTLDLDASFSVSFENEEDAADPDAADPSPLTFTNAEINFGLLLTVNENLAVVPNPDNMPVFSLEEASVENVTVTIPKLVEMTATNATMNFMAGEYEPFLTFGGTQPQEDDAYDAQDPDSLDTVDGSLQLKFINPSLDGLGGEVGNFGVGFDKGALNDNDPETSPLKFYQQEGFFAAITIPEGFKFGLPDWLPIDVTKVGLRFHKSDVIGKIFEETREISLQDLTDVSLIFSGGLQGSDGTWPITAKVENIEVDIAELGDFLPEGDLAHFPITNLDALEFGIAPFDLGVITIAGILGFGLLDIDTDDDGSTDDKAFFAKVGGTFAYDGVGIGVELIVSEHGFIMGRLFAGFPVPIGTIVGGIIGSVVPGLGSAAGANVGTNTGFIITGFQGGLLFGDDPLPQICTPIDILRSEPFEAPLDLGLEDIRAAMEGAAQRTDDFGWGKGFQVVISGVLTNTNVAGLIGAKVTLGANVGYDLSGDSVSHSEACDPDEEDDPSPQDPPAIEIPAGFQLYGRADLEVFGQSLVGAGLAFDYSDPISPGLDIAFAMPGGGNSLLSLLLPADATFGVHLGTDGLVEGSVFAMQAFLTQIFDETTEANDALFGKVLEAVADKLNNNPDSLLSQILLDLESPPDMIDQAFLKDRLIGLDGIFSFDLNSALSQPWEQIETAATVATGLITELLALGPEVVLYLEEDVDLNETFNLLFDKLEQQLAQSLANVVVTDDDQVRSDLALMFKSGGTEPAEPSPVVTAFYEDWEEPFRVSIVAAKLQLAFAQTAGEILLAAGDTAINAFFETIDPELKIEGQVQPTILGFPLGEPRERVAVHLKKDLLQFEATFSILEKLLYGTFSSFVAPQFLPVSETLKARFAVHPENLLRDLALGEPPKLNLMTDPWEAVLAGELQVFGFKVSDVAGVLLPPESDNLHPGAIPPPGPALPEVRFDSNDDGSVDVIVLRDREDDLIQLDFEIVDNQYIVAG